VHSPSKSQYAYNNTYTATEPSEFGTLGGYGSLPSSYRRLRKAKSSLTPRKAVTMSHRYASYSPASARTLRNVKSSLGDAGQGLKIGLKRSISFLRGSSSNLASAFKRSENEQRQNDDAIQAAHNQYLQDLHHQNMQEKPSSIWRPKSEPKAFRKTVRSNRTTAFGNGVKSENQVGTPSKPESKARSLSASLRDRMKRVFGRSIHNKEELPVQQLDASRSYFKDYIHDSSIDSGAEEYFAAEPDAITRGSIYIPSSDEHDSFENLDKMPQVMRPTQSMESLHSNNRSRVTSWTNSTMTDSCTAYNSAEERKRLSVIKEDGGPHQPSSSIGRHIGGIQVFRQPLPLHGRYGPTPPAVDSQRIYSALVKRIDQEQRDSAGVVNPEGFRPVATIRAVSRESSSHTLAPDNEHRQFSMSTNPWHERRDVTPQQQAQNNDNLARRKTRLADQEAQSSFFPFSSQSKPQTPSPFKLALAARKEDLHASDSDSGSVVVTRSQQACNQILGSQNQSAESIYSRTTGGHTNAPHLSAHESPQGIEYNSPIPGMATIIPTKVQRYPRPPPGLLQLHQAKTSERKDRKGWVENQMSNLERRNSRASTSHHREHAQIDGDDAAIGGWRTTPLVHCPSQKTIRPVEPDDPSSVGLHRKPSTMNDRFPLLDLKEVPRSNTPQPKCSAKISKPQAGDLNRARATDDGGRGISTALQRKMSGTLPRKGSGMWRSKDENENSPPVSAPEQPKPSAGPGLNRKTASFAPLKGTTPRAARPGGRFGRNITNSNTNTHAGQGSPDMARLSRPIDMDMPAENRALDGGEMLGGPMADVDRRAGRLGVASPPLRSSPGYAGDDEAGDTALPRMDDKPPAKAMLSSRRMVSNFLRSRRRRLASGSALADEGFATARRSPDHTSIDRAAERCR
jgi:hypothetical protein